MAKMNRGEWGEPYAALKLLGEKKLYLADEDGNPNYSEWMDIIKVVRQETGERVVTYHCNDGAMDIDIEINNKYTKTISADEFKKIAKILMGDIVGSTGRSFSVSQEVVDFLKKAEIQHMKAKSVEKSDIFLDTHDPRSSIVRENIGFSIKCEFGQNPTLFNTAKASAAKYIVSGMNDELMNNINSLTDSSGHAAVSDRCKTILDKGCQLEYVGFEYAQRAKCEAFKENLDLINSNLPTVIQKILWNHFIKKQAETDIVSVTERIIAENPCNLTFPEIKYPYMIKMFLYSAYCGMTASTIWDGKSAVKGGYITIRNTGEVVANYALESEAFKNFLYTHCYLDFPSTDKGHGAYGKVYKEGENYYFKLNFQIRIR